MERERFETLLQIASLGLEKDGAVWRASHERPLTILASIGNDLVRFAKVSGVDLDDKLVEAGLVGLIREESYLVIRMDAVQGAERDRNAESSEKRRTGFI